MRGIEIGEPLRGGSRNKGHRRDGTNIKSANIVFAAHIKATERRDFPAAIAGDVSGGNVGAYYIALFVRGPVHRPIEHVGDAVYVAAQRAARNTTAIEITFAGRGILRFVD